MGGLHQVLGICIAPIYLTAHASVDLRPCDEDNDDDEDLWRFFQIEMVLTSVLLLYIYRVFPKSRKASQGHFTGRQLTVV